MTNVTVQEALKSAIEAMENEDELKPIPFGIRCIRAINKCKSALADIEKCEPVVISEPSYHHEAMGCGLEDRNITDRYEAAKYGWDQAMERIFEQIPEGTLFTSPQPRDWVGLTYKQKVDLREENDWYNFPNDLIEATEAKLKKLNTKG